MKRWITGIILIVAILFIIFYTSAEILGAVIIAIIIGGMWEYNNIVFGRGFLKEKAQTFIFAFVIPLVFLFGDNQLIVAILASCVMIVFIMFLWQVKEENFDIVKIAKVIFGIIYIPFLMSHFILLRKLPDGEWWVMFVLVLALIGDTAALYVGKYFGKKKLLALVSPGKTVEGTIALVCGSILACLIYVYFFMPQLPAHHVFWLFLAASSDSWAIFASPPLKGITARKTRVPCFPVTGDCWIEWIVCCLSLLSFIIIICS